MPADSQAWLRERLAGAKVLPVLRARSGADAMALLQRCADAGLDTIELTTSTAGWPAVLAEARASFPGHVFGVGTVLTAADATTAMAGGAAFLVSPCPAPAVRRATAGRTPFIEGGMTVGELLAASRRGIAKLFPAHVGGPQFLRSVLALSPSAHIVPTGGIAFPDVAEWLAAGALAVGVGRDLFGEADLPAAVRNLIEGDAL
jgi:2-dehydro-3-deoxyphosphogluconate aldolase / (4S)-4-hydroxy-2-oxoglutarate aldolase